MAKTSLSQAKISKIISNPKLFTPLQFNCSDLPTALKSFSRDWDAVVELSYNNKTQSFITKICRDTSPKSIQSLITLLEQKYLTILENKNKACSKKGGELELLFVVPFLTETILTLVEQSKINVIDLCGNYSIRTNSVLAIRTDQQNQYRDSKPIKSIFSGNSSLVPRLLIENNQIYSSVTDVYKALQNKGGLISLSTVSKVLSSLDDQLLIKKDKNEIKVIQPDKIILGLEQGYQKPTVTNEIRLKVNFDQLHPQIPLIKKLISGRWVISGESSAYIYTATTIPNIHLAYVHDLIITDELKKLEDDRFYNVILQETQTPYVFFNMLQEKYLNYSSNIQSYLELNQGNKREREIALNIKESILGSF